MTVIVAKWTIDEYHRMIDAGILSDRKVELLKGEIVEMSAEGEPHAYCSHESADYLTNLLGKLPYVKPSLSHYPTTRNQNQILPLSNV